MKLSELLEVAKIKAVSNADKIEVAEIQSDSRRVKKGSLFVAVKGVAADGHDFIEKAVAQGAVAIVCEHTVPVPDKNAVFITVPDSAAALGMLASAWYGEPSRRMTLVGVTGTNGKTTVATLLYELFRKLGYKAGLLSTVCNYVDDEAIPTDHTTPDPLTINRLMAKMVDAGCEYAFMEASSHAIDQKRISGLDFDGGIFGQRDVLILIRLSASPYLIALSHRF